MNIQELNYNEDNDILLIQFPKDEDLDSVRHTLDAFYETFYKRTNKALAVSDDMEISIIHVNNKTKEDEPF